MTNDGLEAGSARREQNGTRRWVPVIALVSLLIALIGIIYKTGATEASLEIRVANLEQQVHQAQADFARRDVIDQRLLNIEGGLSRLESSEKEDQQALKQILEAQRRGR